jgi:hypothetical protein
MPSTAPTRSPSHPQRPLPPDLMGELRADKGPKNFGLDAWFAGSERRPHEVALQAGSQALNRRCPVDRRPALAGRWLFCPPRPAVGFFARLGKSAALMPPAPPPGRLPAR